MFRTNLGVRTYILFVFLLTTLACLSDNDHHIKYTHIYVRAKSHQLAADETLVVVVVSS